MIAGSQEAGGANNAAATPATTTAPGRERRAAYYFANFVALTPDMLAIACDIWLGDVCRAPWATKEAMRIAALVSAHAQLRATVGLQFKDIEAVVSVQREEINRAFRLLQLFGAIEGFAVQGTQLALLLKLDALQRIRALETGRKLKELAADIIPDRRHRPASSLPTDPV